MCQIDVASGESVYRVCELYHLYIRHVQYSYNE